MTALILAEAEKEADALLAAAKNEADSIVAAYRQQADEETATLTAAIAQEDRSALERAESSARQIRRNARLKAKSDLLDAAFDTALQQMINLPDAERLELYTEIFRSVLSEQLAAERAAAENDPYGEYAASAARQYTLLLSEKDRTSVGEAFLSAASAMAKSAGKQIALSERTVSISGGFVLVCGDVELSCSLGGYMERIRSRIEGEVCQILFA